MGPRGLCRNNRDELPQPDKSSASLPPRSSGAWAMLQCYSSELIDIVDDMKPALPWELWYIHDYG